MRTGSRRTASCQSWGKGSVTPIFLGIDVGSVTTKLVVIDEKADLLASLYTRTMGRPVTVVQAGLKEIAAQLNGDAHVLGAGVTGSARQLIGKVIEADLVKNEITAHAVGATHCCHDTHTVIEIGGQDSKVLILRDGVVTDFAMNTVCAAGTGSFLDQQANRLGIPIDQFGRLALKSKTPVRIAGRCTVFAESDMIHKQQMGHSIEDILYGLCQALARNFLNNLCLGKDLMPPIVFQGGVAANTGMVRAFEELLETQIIVPPHYDIMGAIGIALLTMERHQMLEKPSSFRGWGISEALYETTSFECTGCSNLCEIVCISEGGEVIGRWGSRCNKWEV
jgi:predicted CoA-substrate-specific enzyme activase